MRNKNKSLFMYGFLARLQKILGFLIIGLSFSTYLIFFNEIFVIIGVVAGGFIAFSGASKEYDYKRQGGYIVYND